MEFNQHYNDYEKVRKALKDLVSVVAHESVKDTGDAVKKEVDELVDSYCNSFQDVCIKDIWKKIVEYNEVSKPRYEIIYNKVQNGQIYHQTKYASKACFATEMALKMKGERNDYTVSVNVYDRKEKETILYL